MPRRYAHFARLNDGWTISVVSADVTLADRQTRPYLALTVLSYQPRDNGFPTDSEYGRTRKLEERLAKKLESDGAIHVGHLLGKKSFVIAFYSAKPLSGPTSVKTGLFKQETVSLEARLDKDWTWYTAELEPTEAELQARADLAVLEKLKEAGDDHSKARPVDFAVVFPSESQLNAFAEAVAQHGYELNREGAWEPSDSEFGCELVCFTSIEPATLTKHCEFLTQEARLHGGEWDGWASPIAK